MALVMGLAPNAAREAHAQAPAAADPRVAEIALEVEPGAGGLDAGDVRAAIERELELPTVPATPSSQAVLSVRARGERRVLMSFRQSNGRGDRQVEREVALPAERPRALETLGLLAVNMVRNEAAELLAAMLEKRRRETPAPPVAPPPAAPALAAPAVTPPPADVLPCARRDGYAFVHFGADVAPYVGTSHWEAPRTVRRLSLQFAGGHTEGVHGAGISPLVHTTSSFVCGAEVSGIGNIVGGPVQGAQVSGAFNYAHDLHGAQVSGAFNYAHDVRGAQVSGGVAIAKSLTGAQVAPVNISSGDVIGAQTGVVNVTNGTVRGVQIGVVNYADDSDFSLGVVNIMKKGRIGVDTFATETGYVTLALKSGGTHWHSFYGVGARSTDQEQRWSYLLGFGAHITPSSHFYVDLDLLANLLVHDITDFSQPPNGWLAQARGVVGFRPIPLVSIYAGPTFNGYFTDRGSEPPFRSGLVSSYTSGSLTYSQWPGFTVGLQMMTGD